MKDLWQKDGKPDWDAIEAKDWFVAMQNCPQDPVFHAEGNVGIHTKMVIEALLQLEEWSTLSNYEQQILLWSALLHDIAKPLCTTTDEKGHIRAPKHTEIGEKMVRQMLWNMKFEDRELICALVRLHGLPIWCMEKQNPYRAVAQSSLRLTNRLLYLLSKADVLGRKSISQDDFLDRVELFKEFCIEQECWEQPKKFYNQHSQFKFFAKNDVYPAIIYDDTSFEIFLLSGLPGCGKDTYAKTLKLPVISLDDIRQELGIKYSDKKGQGKVAQLAYKRAKSYAAQQKSFIWNSTNLTKDLRTRLIRTLRVYNPKFKIVYIETSIENILSRRKGEIPRKKIEKMLQILDLPLADEAHDVKYFRN